MTTQEREADADPTEALATDYAWAPVETAPKYARASLESSVCVDSEGASCGQDHYCMKHMWAADGQTDSGLGCWHKSVCEPGSNSFTLKGKAGWKL